jgi:hypothetical protein
MPGRVDVAGDGEPPCSSGLAGGTVFAAGAAASAALGDWVGAALFGCGT